MANIIKRVWNQNRMVQIEDLRGMTFQAEAAGHTFQISGIDDDGNTVALTGTPSGVLLRPDNTDVALTCSVSGGVVSATLPANCYDVPGRFGLTIFITSGSSKTAIYAAVGTVTRTSSGTVAPGTSQSVVDLINAINAAVNSIPASYSALLADIAPTYSNSALYSVGQYAWYDGDLKRCIVPITTAESYTAAHWTSAVLGKDVSDLKSALYNSFLNTDDLADSIISGNRKIDFYWEQGGYDSSGNKNTSGTQIRTVISPIKKGDILTIKTNNIKVNLFIVKFNSSGTYIGTDSLVFNDNQGYTKTYMASTDVTMLFMANGTYSAVKPEFGGTLIVTVPYINYSDIFIDESIKEPYVLSPGWEQGGYNNGVESSSASQIRTRFIKTSKIIRLFDITYTTPSKDILWYYVLFDDAKQVLSTSSVCDYCDTIEIPDTATYIRFVMTIGNPTVPADGKYVKLSFLPITKWFGKKMAVYGDSLSTFLNVSVSAETAYYPHGNINRVQETWWYRTMRKLGMTLETANAYGGSSVTSPNDNTYMADTTRLATLGSPDLILFCGGTNDIYMNRSIGEWQGWDVTTLESYTWQFLPAYTRCLSYMQDEYNCKIISITPAFIESEGHSGRENCTLENIEKFIEAIKESCSYMGVECVDTRKLGMTIYNISDYTVDEMHWDVNFTTLLAEHLFSMLK